MEVISVESPLFKHQRLEADLRRLAEGMPAGSRLPAEQVLARQYGCNYQTVRRALKALVEDGTVVRLVGKGTFVGGAGTVGEVGAKQPVSGQVGVLMWSAGNGVAGMIMASLTRAAAELGVDLRSAWIGDFEKDALAAAASLAKQGCTALILPWFPPHQTHELRVFVEACALPLSLPMLVPGVGAGQSGGLDAGRPSVVEALVGYYRAQGCGRIVFVGPDSSEDLVLQRFLTAYVCSLSRAGLESCCHLVKAGDPAMDQVARRCVSPRGDLAVIAYDDEHALRFMAAMKRLGLMAPRDFRIIGFNDTEAAQWSEPPLSTVRYDYQQVGRWLLGRALNTVKAGARDQVAPRLQLVVRSSCGGAQGAAAKSRARVAGIELVTD